MSELTLGYYEALEHSAPGLNNEELLQSQDEVQSAAIQLAIDREQEAFEQVSKAFNLQMNCQDQLEDLTKLNALKRKTVSAPSRDESMSVFDVAPVEGNRQHRALACLYGYKMIPVKNQVTNEVDFDRIPLQDRVKSPLLELKTTKTTKRERAIELVIVLQPTGLSSRFETSIKHPKYGDKSWDMTKACVMDIFKFDMMQGELLQQLFSVAPLPNEDVHVFMDRVEHLIEAAGAKEGGQILCAKIVSCLPNIGQEKVGKHFGPIRGIVK
ncbi:hypothetical protein BGW38_005636, partial [Lunasporangiospora selenospora]